MCSDAPDTSKSQEAALMTANLSKEQLDWAKQIYAETAPERAAASKRANEVSDLQIDGTRKAITLADSYDQYNKSTFQPLEREIVADARNFNTEAERERLAGQAGADVAQAFGAARSQGVRQLGRMGVNTSDGRMLGTLRELGAAEALGTAQAKNKSRQDSLTLGRALKMDAASLGRNLPSQQATQTSLALNSGNSSVGNAGAALNPSSQAQIMLGNAYGGARQGYGQASNIYGNIANTEAGVDSANSATAGQAGAAIGTIAVMI